MSHPLPTAIENPTGFHRKYNVTKADGSPCDPDAVYLVLRIDENATPNIWSLAAVDAARAYCDGILMSERHEMTPVARDILKIIDRSSSVQSAVADMEPCDDDDLLERSIRAIELLSMGMRSQRRVSICLRRSGFKIEELLRINHDLMELVADYLDSVDCVPEEFNEVNETFEALGQRLGIEC